MPTDSSSTGHAPVVVRREPVTFPAYAPCEPDLNPMFIEKRVYQGSSGRVYPLPFTDRIQEAPQDRQWDAVWLENEFVRVMILPEIGGRIHVGQDKSNGYDFFYRQRVIKPALVGLAGPWISGGVEFNWPQHHRPSTFMPVDIDIETADDGSITVWCSEHEPMQRMKGMHGVCLRPHSACVELRVRLYNRTPLVQTFLWWANVAARVHEQYQSFFPPDVHYVADHAKRAMTTFPTCRGSYYGVDYRPGTRLDWYKNIPVPTSYMCMGTQDDFFGGYDHAAQAGFVHVANHHISPGKKQWTWGNHPFGYAWDRNLTDQDGPYVELMAGVYTDNQPDFSFLHPYETRTFTQCWFPIQQIGPAKQANLAAAVNLTMQQGACTLGVAVTEKHAHALVELRDAVTGATLLEASVPSLTPTTPYLADVPLPPHTQEHHLRLSVRTAGGRLLIRYAPKEVPSEPKVPDPATQPPAPEAIASNDELYVTGLHLDQYRHPTREATAYWREALRRDAGDARCNTAMGLWHYRRGEFTAALEHLQRAVQRLTVRNPNPYDAEALYALGLTLRMLGRDDEAYDALYKATWNYAWQAPSFVQLAQIDCRRQDWSTAEEHLQRALAVNAACSLANNLMVIVRSKACSTHLAPAPPGPLATALHEALETDPLDWCARHLAEGRAGLRCDAQAAIDLAIDYMDAGLYEYALDVLQAYSNAPIPRVLGAAPLVHYYQARCHAALGQQAEADAQLAAGAAACPDYVFPARLHDMLLLEWVCAQRPLDGRAAYYLGNLLYDRRRYAEAVALWETATRLVPEHAVAWRNLGIARFNAQHDKEGALNAYTAARAAAPTDSRLLYEHDQLRKRLGHPAEARLAALQAHPQLVNSRDALAVEVAALLNQTGRADEALSLLQGRRFQPWEGGEGEALGQWVRTHCSLGRAALSAGDAQQAVSLLEAALHPPDALGEAKHLLANDSDVRYWLGCALQQAGREEEAREQWAAAAAFRGDFQGMAVTPYSEMTLFSALALEALGSHEELLVYATDLEHAPASIDYFATSLPTMLLFNDDLQARQVLRARFLQAQARFGLGERVVAKHLVEEVLVQDPSHAMAADLLSLMQ